MTTIDDQIQLTSIREDAPTEARRRSPARSVFPARVGAVLAIATAVLAVVQATDARLGPGRFVLLGVVAAWCLSALAVSSVRPDEPLATLMTLIGGVIALAMLAAAEYATHPTYDLTAFVRAATLALLPALGAHLAAALPDGRMTDPGRRIAVGCVYAGGIALAVWTYTQRPDLPVGGFVGLSAVAAAVGVTGFVGRCRRARTQAARARLQWPAWGVLTGAAIAIGALVLDTLVHWPGEILAITVGATALLPLSLAAGAHPAVALAGGRDGALGEFDHLGLQPGLLHPDGSYCRLCEFQVHRKAAIVDGLVEVP